MIEYPTPYSLLIVPASDGRRLDETSSLGASPLVLDLASDVAGEVTDRARFSTAVFLDAHRDRARSIMFRVNNPYTSAGIYDVRAIESFGDQIDALLLPHATSQGVRTLQDICEIPIIAIVDGAEVGSAPEIAAQPQVLGLAFGNGASAGSHALNRVKARLVDAAMDACKWALAGASSDQRIGTELAPAIREEVAMGFMGKLCESPLQVGLVNKWFAADQEVKISLPSLMPSASLPLQACVSMDD